MNTSEIKNRTVYVLCRTDKSEDGSDLYIGSTSRSLKERLRCHKKGAERLKYRNIRLYKRMNDSENWKIIPLVTFACGQKTIFEFERDWIQIFKTDLNMIFPVTDREKYGTECHKNNRDAILKRQAGYRKANRDAISRKDAEYRKITSRLRNTIATCVIFHLDIERI